MKTPRKPVPGLSQPTVFIFTSAPTPYAHVDGRRDMERRYRHHPDRLENVHLAKQGLRRCTICKEIKPFSDYHRGEAHDDVHSSCKTCAHESARRRFTKRYYGIAYDAYLARFGAQQSTCAICGALGELPDAKMRTGRRGHSGVLCVDHDHKTGKVGGLLCARRNSALGLLRDDIGLFMACSGYLQTYQI